jgi:hypothetical protein
MDAIETPARETVARDLYAAICRQGERAHGTRILFGTVSVSGSVRSFDVVCDAESVGILTHYTLETLPLSLGLDVIAEHVLRVANEDGVPSIGSVARAL